MDWILEVEAQELGSSLFADPLNLMSSGLHYYGAPYAAITSGLNTCDVEVHTYLRTGTIVTPELCAFNTNIELSSCLPSSKRY